MKRCGLRVFVAIALITLAVVPQGLAQDFQQLLNAVDRVESNLKVLIEKEAATRASEIAKLRQELAGQATATGGTNGDEVLSRLRSELDSMVAEVAKLSGERQLVSADNEGVSVSSPTAAQVETLTADLASLNDRLEAYLATDFSAPEATPPAGATSQTEHASLPEIKLSGFVDASVVEDRNADRNSFSVDEMETDLEHNFADRAQMRADIEYVNDGGGQYQMNLEQAYLAYSLGSVQKWIMSFGKFNAPIGFEACDAPDRHQYSFAAIAKYCDPGNLTGAKMYTRFSPTVDATVYLANGWDINSDNNSGKTLGTRWGFNPLATLNIGLSAITGAEQADRTDSRRSVFDLDFNYNVTPSFLIGGEVNYGMESKVLATGADAKWFGFLLTNNIQLSRNVKLTTRVDYLKDNDGYLMGQPQDLKAITIAPKLEIVEGLEGLVEFKYELSNMAVFSTSAEGQSTVQRQGPQSIMFESGDQRNNRLLFALEMTYRF